jgi:hypothetical protein
LVITDESEKSAYGYTDESTVTLSDWFVDFYHAEERALKRGGLPDTADANTGTCGDPAYGKVKGIEYPADRVLFNDVDGYDLTTTSGNANGIARKTVTMTCGATKRIRFINMSSHARLYIWFSDQRSFSIIELDGVLYDPRAADMFELASGQRASILLTASSGSITCQGAYIVVASDPRINAGTPRCPQVSTRNGRGLLYTHGYLDVDSSSKPRKQTLDVTDSDLGIASRFDIWASQLPSPSTGYIQSGYQYYNNRLHLDPGYQVLYYNKNSKTDYGYQKTATRNERVPVGIVGSHDYELSPRPSQAPWWPPRPAAGKQQFIHYIKLHESSEDKYNVGFAAMTDNPLHNAPRK